MQISKLSFYWCRKELENFEFLQNSKLNIVVKMSENQKFDVVLTF